MTESPSSAVSSSAAGAETRPNTCRTTRTAQIDPDGKLYPPFHDMMMLVEGNAAARPHHKAREHWRRGRDWTIKPPLKPRKSPAS